MSAFTQNEGVAGKARNAARAIAIAGLSVTRSPSKSTGWIRFPYYHHVFDDERDGFRRQIRYLKNIADIVSMDDAVKLMTEGASLDDRYICITFDDGFKNWIENAVPILVEEKAVAAFFVATGYIDTDLEKDRDKLLAFYEDGTRLMEFLSWQDCRDIVSAGMAIGSHSVGHVHLLDLDDSAAANELLQSKQMIEREVGVPCHHFCCPFGRAGIDYDPERHPEMARKAGFASFLTGHRGENRAGGSPYDIRRDHVLANWGNYQLRYFLGS